MKVYQLRVRDLNILLEPVFKDMESANLFKNKYDSRSIDIIANNLESEHDYVYRIKRIDEDGYELMDNLFTDLDELLNFINIKGVNNYSIVKESILGNSNFKYSLIEV